MRTFPSRVLVWTLAVAGFLSAGAASAEESPLAGTWKVIVVSGGDEITVWQIKLEETDGKASAKLLSAGLPQFKDVKIKNVKIKGGTVYLTFALPNVGFNIVAHAAKDDKAPKTLLGSVTVRNQQDLVRMERDGDKALDPDPKAAIKPTPAKAAFRKAIAADDKEQALKDFLKENGKEPLAHQASLELLRLTAAKEDAKEADLKPLAQQSVEVLAPYGPEAKLRALGDVSRLLAKSKAGAGLALDYAQQAEKLLSPSDPAAVRLPVLQTLAKALRTAGKDDEAKALTKQITALNHTLDEEFQKTAVPFKVEPFAGRKGKSNRAVVLELFTGAQCPPCVSADVAFDGLLKAYKSADVVLLQYHLHIPGPDPLTNKDSESRSAFYEVRGTPTVFINGQKGPAVGGFKPDGEDRYTKLRGVLDEKLEEDPQGTLKLKAALAGDNIDLTAEFSGLKKTGKDVRLRFVLVEEVVRWPGSNGQRLHHHVVRALPGGADGFAVEDKDGKQTAAISVKGLAKSLQVYLESQKAFAGEDVPLDLRHMRVVALVQDNDSKEILAAAQVDLPGTKTE